MLRTFFVLIVVSVYDRTKEWEKWKNEEPMGKWQMRNKSAFGNEKVHTIQGMFQNYNYYHDNHHCHHHYK